MEGGVTMVKFESALMISSTCSPDQCILFLAHTQSSQARFDLRPNWFRNLEFRHFNVPMEIFSGSFVELFCITMVILCISSKWTHQDNGAD